MYQNTSSMTPFLPEYGKELLEKKINMIIKDSYELNAVTNRILRNSIYELVKDMNGYYSNLIEGNTTLPIEIEEVMSGTIKNSKKIEMILENFSHIIVQENIRKMIEKNPSKNLMNKEFLISIHRDFYENMKIDNYLQYLEQNKNKIFKNDLDYENKIIGIKHLASNFKNIKFPVYGKFRGINVKVGKHYPPFYEYLDNFIDKLFTEYKIDENNIAKSILNICALHHRLVWIHPFEDGNGRVSRLFSHALLDKIGISSSGLWSISRGLARNKEKYYAFLENADSIRNGDLDGRGNLSDKGLFEFCNFFIDVMLDQIKFSRELFQLDKLEERYNSLVDSIENILTKRKSDFMKIIRILLIKGEISKNEIPHILEKPDRTTRDIMKSMVDNGLIYSENNKDSIKLNLSIKNSKLLFPNLFPNESFEAESQSENEKDSILQIKNPDELKHLIETLELKYPNNKTEIIGIREIIKMCLNHNPVLFKNILDISTDNKEYSDYYNEIIFTIKAESFDIGEKNQIDEK